MKRVVSLFVTAGLLLGQQFPRGTVISSGRVVDGATKAGIPGVAVVYGSFDDPAWTPPAVQTDEHGAFSATLPVGQMFSVTAKTDGMLGEPQQMVVIRTHPGSDPAVAPLVLWRPSTVEGRVVDADSGAPIAGVGVNVFRTGFKRGQREVDWQAMVEQEKTDADGRFRITGLIPVSMVIELNPRATNYSRRFWPGGPNADSVAPFEPSSGGTLNLGTIALRGVKARRVKVRTTGDCENVALAVQMQQGRGVAASAVKLAAKCGGDAVFEGVPPGSYSVSVSSDDAIANEMPIRGTAAVIVGDRDLDVAVEVRRPAVVKGSVMLVDKKGDSRPLDGVPVSLGPPLAGSNVLDFVQRRTPPIPTTVEGKFEIRMVSTDAAEVQALVAFQDSARIVTSVSYNGKTTRGDRFSFDPKAQTQVLRIECSDVAASLSGQVKGTGKRWTVLVSPLPLGDEVYPLNLMETETDADGRFLLGRLLPGSYRVIAVDPESRAELEMPWVLTKRLESGKTVEVGDGAPANVSIESR